MHLATTFVDDSFCERMRDARFDAFTFFVQKLESLVVFSKRAHLNIDLDDF